MANEYVSPFHESSLPRAVGKTHTGDSHTVVTTVRSKAKGDQILAQKVSLELGQPVSQGDIVVFHNPDGTSEHDVLVKRVIATAGQTVDLQDGKVVVDGQALDEGYTTGMSWPLSVQAPGAQVSYPYTVPDGCVWVMGDNRENSADSRYFGPVDRSDLIAVALVRYWPLNRIGAID